VHLNISQPEIVGKSKAVKVAQRPSTYQRRRFNNVNDLSEGDPKRAIAKRTGQSGLQVAYCSLLQVAWNFASPRVKHAGRRQAGNLSVRHIRSQHVPAATLPGRTA
jgi:hypothetical protein